MDAGEDWVAVSPGGYAANLDVAQSQLEPVDDTDTVTDVREFATPGIHTIDDLEHFGVPANRQVKTLVFMAQGEPLVILLRGDHQLSEAKLAQSLGTTDLRLAEIDEALEVMGANFGSLGPVGIKARIIADRALEGRRGLVSGANKDGFHLEGLEPGRDFTASFRDVRVVQAGEMALDGSGPITVKRGLELGHIFKLGTRYASAMNANVMGKDGKNTPLVMGSYGIGLERLLAAIVEHHGDEKGLRWPISVAPFDVIVLELGDTAGAATKIYEDLKASKLEVLFDDRDERAGVKFSEAELFGVPFTVVAGARGLERGVVEVRNRLTGEAAEVSLEGLNEHLLTQLKTTISA
jgi:prolyl-tRNA synthetase